MLYRSEELKQFIGIKIEIYAEEVWERNIVLRETLSFKTYDETEAFLSMIENHKIPHEELQQNRKEALKYILHEQDTYEKVILTEYTADGKVYILKRKEK